MSDDLVTKKAIPGDHPKRQWKRAHRAAGYHLKNWAPVTPDHPCLGEYELQDGSLLTVRYLEKGHTVAPEYELDWETGPTLTVLDHTVVEEYLEMHNAVRKGG